MKPRSLATSMLFAILFVIVYLGISSPSWAATVSRAELADAVPLTNHIDGDVASLGNFCAGLSEPLLDPGNRSRDGSGFSVAPGSLDISNLQPSTDYLACATVFNFSSTTTVEYEISGRDVEGNQDPESSLHVLNEAKNAGSWILPSVSRLKIGPSEQWQIPFVIRTPAKLPAGSIVGVLAVRDVTRSMSAVVTQRLNFSFPGGERRKLEVEDIESSRLISGKPGKAALRISFLIKNPSDYVESYHSETKVSGFGREVGTKVTEGAKLLPGAVRAHNIQMRNLPWVGVFTPTVTLTGPDGVHQTLTLPRLYVLPPRGWVIAVLVAALLPLGWWLFTWWRARREWLEYYEQELANEQFEEFDQH